MKSRAVPNFGGGRMTGNNKLSYGGFSNAAQSNDEQSCLLWGESLIAFVKMEDLGPKEIVDLSTPFIIKGLQCTV